MNVSVIIPVYQAEDFVSSAVASALQQPQTGEVILVEDGSRDHSLEICRSLTADPRVRLYTHPGNVNRGASASRNLGIHQAQHTFIAFLDADDIYLPDRFACANEIFTNHPDADGVYETIGVQYYDEALRSQHLIRTGNENTGIRIIVPPVKLFRTLASGDHGHIHLNGLLLRRQSLDPENLFDEDLVLSEDSDFILRIAATHTLYGGDPARIVALRGVHGSSTVYTNPNAVTYRRRYLRKCIEQNFYGSKDAIACLHVVKRFIGASAAFAPFVKFGKLALPVKFFLAAGFVLLHPKVLFRLTKRLL